MLQMRLLRRHRHLKDESALRAALWWWQLETPSSYPTVVNIERRSLTFRSSVFNGHKEFYGVDGVFKYLLKLKLKHNASGRGENSAGQDGRSRERSGSPRRLARDTVAETAALPGLPGRCFCGGQASLRASLRTICIVLHLIAYTVACIVQCLSLSPLHYSLHFTTVGSSSYVKLARNAPPVSKQARESTSPHFGGVCPAVTVRGKDQARCTYLTSFCARYGHYASSMTGRSWHLLPTTVLFRSPSDLGSRNAHGREDIGRLVRQYLDSDSDTCSCSQPERRLPDP